MRTSVNWARLNGNTCTHTHTHTLRRTHARTSSQTRCMARDGALLTAAREPLSVSLSVCLSVCQPCRQNDTESDEAYSPKPKAQSPQPKAQSLQPKAYSRLTDLLVRRCTAKIDLQRAGYSRGTRRVLTQSIGRRAAAQSSRMGRRAGGARPTRVQRGG